MRGIRTPSIQRIGKKDPDQRPSDAGSPAVCADDAQPLEPLAETGTPDPLSDTEVEETEAEKRNVVSPRIQGAFDERLNQQLLPADGEHEDHIGNQKGDQVIDPTG